MDRQQIMWRPEAISGSLNMQYMDHSSTPVGWNSLSPRCIQSSNVNIYRSVPSTCQVSADLFVLKTGSILNDDDGVDANDDDDVSDNGYDRIDDNNNTDDDNDAYDDDDDDENKNNDDNNNDKNSNHRPQQIICLVRGQLVALCTPKGWSTPHELCNSITVTSYCFTIVYSTVYSGVDQRKHQNATSLAFVRGIHQSLVNFPHTKGQ